MKPERTHELKVPAAMEMLRPGEVKPRGWLRDWCVTARNGYVSRLGQIDPNIDRAWTTFTRMSRHRKVLRDAMPRFWDWPLASPVRIRAKDADGSPLELVPYGCAKLRISMFPDEAGK